MLKRRHRAVIAVSFIAVCLMAGCSPKETTTERSAATPPAPAAAKDEHAGHDHGPGESHSEGTSAAEKPAKPAAKPAATAAKPAGPPPGHRPPAMPPPAPNRRQWDVPQAKNLAETPDVVLNSKVKASLISNLSSAASDIWPETARGVVTLTGTVPTAQQRAQAEQVAKRVRGIRAVKNQLKVKPGA